MGLIKEDSCLRKIIYFVKKENIFSASNHGFTTTATEMGALEGLQGDLAKRTKLAIFSKLPAQHNTSHVHHHIHSSTLSLQKEN